MSSASAKIILFGEHAVVYNKPAIAIPVNSLRAYAEVEAENTAFQIVARDLDNEIITFEGDNPLSQIVRATLEVLNQDIPNIRLSVRSNIPIASGLGSGAAISTAIVRELADYFAITLSQETINDLVYEVEKIHHGTPSGIDNTVIVYEQAMYFWRKNLIEPIRSGADFRILIADTGKKSLTKHAVGDVRKLYESFPKATYSTIDFIGRITEEAKSAMEGGDERVLGFLMRENHMLLQQLTVSSPELDNLVETAIKNGALGAKLSGGGRGGNMIALVNDETAEKVAEALKSAGAVRVIETVLEKNS
ncbi:MAG: mevalonate kinase [Phototrophicaceae bacterium]